MSTRAPASSSRKYGTITSVSSNLSAVRITTRGPVEATRSLVICMRMASLPRLELDHEVVRAGLADILRRVWTGRQEQRLARFDRDVLALAVGTREPDRRVVEHVHDV